MMEVGTCRNEIFNVHKGRRSCNSWDEFFLEQ